MTAGALSHAGYHMGQDYMAASPGNPKGYFEDRTVNDINERLLAQVCPSPPLGPVGRRLWPRGLRYGQRWVAQIPLDSKILCPQSTAGDIESVVGHQPFCLKDPRLCYTLPCWRPHLPDDTVFVCVFRHPAATADSIVRECSERPYLHNLQMNRETALRVWTFMYRHILEKHRATGDWLFLHFDQIVSGDGLHRLAAFVDAPVDANFPDRSIPRATSSGDVPEDVLKQYEALCTLSRFDG